MPLAVDPKSCHPIRLDGRRLERRWPCPVLARPRVNVDEVAIGIVVYPHRRFSSLTKKTLKTARRRKHLQT